MGDSHHWKVKVMLGNYECKYARWYSPEKISCVVSPGYGFNNTVQVIIHDFMGQNFYKANLTVG